MRSRWAPRAAIIKNTAIQPAKPSHANQCRLLTDHANRMPNNNQAANKPAVSSQRRRRQRRHTATVSLTCLCSSNTATSAVPIGRISAYIGTDSNTMCISA